MKVRILKGFLLLIASYVNFFAVADCYSQNDNYGDIAIISSSAENRAYITYGGDEIINERWPQEVGNNREYSYLASDFSGSGFDDIACIDFDEEDDAYAFITNSPGKTIDDITTWSSALRNSNDLTFYFLPGDYDGDGYYDIAAFYLENDGNDNDVFASIVYGPDGSFRTSGADDWSFIGHRDSAFLSARFLSDNADNDQFYDISAITDNGGSYLVDFYLGPNGIKSDTIWEIFPPSVNDRAVSFRSGNFNDNEFYDIATFFYNEISTEYTVVITLGPDGDTSRVWNLGSESFFHFLTEDFTGNGRYEIAGVINETNNRRAIIFEGDEDAEFVESNIWELDNTQEDITNILSGNFERPTYTISGTVYQADGTTGLAFVTVDAGFGLTAITDSNGNYEITGAPNGTYYVSASAPGTDFNPEVIVVNIFEDDVENVNFFTSGENPEIFSISGRVTQVDGTTGLDGVRLTTDQGHETFTNSAGLYEFENLPVGLYIVSPYKEGHNFDQSSQIVIINGINEEDVNFRATNNPSIYSISGTVFRASGTEGLDDALITLSDQSSSESIDIGVTTDANGNFIFENISSGIYLLSVSKPRFEFVSGGQQVVVVNGFDVENINFLASNEPSMAIRGRVSISGNMGVLGAVVQAGPYYAITDINGEYEIPNVSYGTYNLTASLAGHNIVPSSFANPVKASLFDLNGMDFESSCIKEYSQVGANCIIIGQAPEPPSGLVATKGDFGSHVLITWSAAEGAIEYQLYRSKYPDGPGVTIGEPFNALAIQDRTAVPGITYYYSVRAINNTGFSEFSNTDFGFRKITPQNTPDEQDLSDKFKIHLKSPIFTGYNTFLDQYSFLELISAGESTVKSKIYIYDRFGKLLNEVKLDIFPKEQIDLNLSTLVNEIDTYGVIKIEYNSLDEGVELRGRITNYSFNQVKNRFNFAYSRELKNSTRGISYAVANSMDPQGLNNPVFNWAEITNVDNQARNFTYNLYDQDGERVSGPITISLPPFGRFDVSAGHELGEGVFLAEIIPHNGAFQYLSGISRYGNITENGFVTEYNFAYPIQTRQGISDTQYVITTNKRGDCWAQTNWLEIANVRGMPVVASLTFRNQRGGLITQSNIEIPSRGIRHINAGALTEINSLGSVEITPNKKGSLIVENIVYYHNCEEDTLLTAHGSSSRIESQNYQVGSFNRYFDSKNLLNLLNIGDDEGEVTVQINRKSSTVELNKITLDKGEIVTIDLGSYLPAKVNGELVGTITVESDTGIISENIRVKENIDGKVDYSIPTEVR